MLTILYSLSFHTHIIELCLFLAVEKCSCLVFRWHRNSRHRSVRRGFAYHAKDCGFETQDFCFMFFCPVSFFHCYKYVNILPFLRRVSVFFFFFLFFFCFFFYRYYLFQYTLTFSVLG